MAGSTVENKRSNYISSRKKPRSFRENKRSIQLALFVVLILSAVLIWRGYFLKKRADVYKANCEVLTEKIEKEQERTRELEEYQEYINTDEFIEQYAKEHFGLVRKDWIQFKSE